MSDLQVHHLLQTGAVSVRDVHCAGTCRHRSAEECATVTHLVFPYFGAYVRHVGRQQAFADTNHVLFFNANEGYQVSHPVKGGDGSLSIGLSDDLLCELSPSALLADIGDLRFRGQHRRIDAGGQMLVAYLRHRLVSERLEPLEAENLVFSLIKRSLGSRTSYAPDAAHTAVRLVDRVKALLCGDISRRWTLGEVAAEIGCSPVYLTQLFQDVEGLPLYRYHLRLRLARALDLIPKHHDLATLGLELGFSSHSHFTQTFRQAYECTPSEFKRSVRSGSMYFRWKEPELAELNEDAGSARRESMLELRPNCECCDRDLPPDSRDARMCSFECTFCADCAENILGGQCPNCGGDLVIRPGRPAALLAQYPASTKRIVKKDGCAHASA